jgi:hypothetical protein
MAKGDLRSGSEPLKKVLEMMIEDMGHGDKLLEAKILIALPEILGEGIMKKVNRFYIRDRKLFLKITSAPMKHELFLMKEAIIEKLNKVNEDALLVDIIFH